MIARGTFGDALEAVEGAAVPIQVGVEEVIQLLDSRLIQPARDELDELHLNLRWPRLRQSEPRWNTPEVPRDHATVRR